MTSDEPPVDKPTAPSTLERVLSLANREIWTLQLQRRRLHSAEPEDGDFLFRWWADLQFYIIALRRLRRCADLIHSHPEIDQSALEPAVTAFDERVPALRVMRNVGEHFDEYALDKSKRHHPNVSRRDLQVGEWDGRSFKWLGETLDIDDAMHAAEELYEAMNAFAFSPLGTSTRTLSTETVVGSDSQTRIATFGPIEAPHQHGRILVQGDLLMIARSEPASQPKIDDQ